MAVKQDELYKNIVDIQSELLAIKLQMSEFHAKTTAQNDVTNVILQGINDHLDKLNSKVASHEKIINDRAAIVIDYDHFKADLASIPDRVRVLEDKSLSSASIRKFVTAIFASGIALGGLIVGIIGLIMK
jgi:hypothetical protein